MAKIGLKGFWAGKFTESETGFTIAEGKKVAKAIDYAPTAQVNEATMYGDDALDSRVRAITSIALAITPTDTSEDINELTGVVEATKTINGEEVTITAIGGSDQGVYTSIGVLITNMSNNLTTYRVEIHPRCIFTPNTDDTVTTKGDSISFATTTVNGTAYQDKDGHFRWVKDFTSEADATAFLNKTFAITA